MANGTPFYGRLSYDRDIRKWVVRDVPPHVSMRIKDVFRRVWKGTSGEFRFPDDDLHAHELLWFLERYPLEISSLDRARMKRGRKRFLSEQATVEKILLPEYVPGPVKGLRDGCALFPYQARLCEVFAIRKRLLIGDDMGLGKTNEAIGCLLAAAPRTLPAAVVVQAHLTEQWQDRIEDFSTLRTHVIKTVEPYELPAADVYIFSYSKLHGWNDLFRDGYFRAAVLDEPQELRSGLETLKGSSAKILCDAAEYVIGLTATPVMNYGIDMFRVMEFIAPGALGTLDEFIREWCNGDKVVRDPEALGTYLREQQLMIRRTERDVGHEMPQPIPIPNYIDYDEKVAAASEELAVTLAIKATTGSFVERGRAYRDLDALARLTTGVAKARGVAAYVRILLENDVPVLLAGWHREVYDIWNGELSAYRPVMFTGSESRRAKRMAVQEFVSGRSPLMMISLRSGAGLDGLQHRCRDLVLGELDWSPMIHKQLIGRLRRSGAVGAVNVHYMIANGGSDPLMVEVAGIKFSQADGIMNPNGSVVQPISDESRMKRLAEHFLAKRAGSSREVTIAA